jgi:predicted SAM-dependent methyltransferase
MTKLNLGCGSNVIDGWLNFDLELDIRHKLPFDANSVDCIFAEHVIEHVTHQEAFNFIENCYDILRPGGKIRICVPSVNLIYSEYTDRYGQFVSLFTQQEPTAKNAVKAILFQHGHQSAWNEQLLDVLMKSIGFTTYPVGPEICHFDEFAGCDGHHNKISSEFNNIETIAIEGIKL